MLNPRSRKALVLFQNVNTVPGFVRLATKGLVTTEVGDKT